jgi:beta-galactosidase
MAQFIAKDGQFWLDGQPQLIHAAEFHYFRTPKDQWRHRLGLLQAAGFNTLAAYIPWIWHQLEDGVSDFDGHSHPMRDLAGFLDLAAEMNFLIIARPGPYIMAETINEGIPPWVFEHYPQAAWISQEGKVQNIASYLHPDFLACVSHWYQAIFGVLTPRQVTRGGKIIMIQLDNEMGMMPWVRNIFDTNPDTIDRFASYIVNAYGPVLLSRYPAGDLSGFLREGIMHPDEQFAERIVEDYRAFYRIYLRDYATLLWDEAKKNGMDVLPVINIHGFANGGKTFPIGISQLIDVMEIDGMLSATDVYPGIIGEGTYHQLLLVNEMTKALHYPEQALFSIEFQSGGSNDHSNTQTSLFDLHTRLCLSSGMRAINHYLFFAGENDPILSPVKRHDWGPPVRKDGSVRQHYFRYPRLSRVLNTYGEALTLAQPEYTTTIGFLLDYFMTEVNNAYTRQASNILTHQRDVVLFDFLGRGLALTHRPFNTIELSRGELDAAKTPLLWVMMEKQCNAATQQKVVDYLEQGGRLVLAGRMCVEDFHHRPCTILKDALGIQGIEGGEPFVPALIRAFDITDIPVSFVERYQGDFAETWATNHDGSTVGFIQSVGAGKAMVFGAALSIENLDDLAVVDKMGTAMGCPPMFDLSEWADVRFSRGERGSFLFVNNYGDDPVETTIKYYEKSLFGNNPLRLPARRGLILPVNWQVNDAVLVHFATTELTSVAQDGNTLVLRGQQDDFSAILTLKGYACEQAQVIEKSAESQRIWVATHDGTIRLTPI